MIPLLECPFCRGFAKVFCIGDRTYCQCQEKGCGAYIGVDGKDNIQLVMQKWNRRDKV